MQWVQEVKNQTTNLCGRVGHSMAVCSPLVVAALLLVMETRLPGRQQELLWACQSVPLSLRPGASVLVCILLLTENADFLSECVIRGHATVCGCLSNRKHHSVAIAQDGTAFSWGANKKGQCGTGASEDVVKVRVSADSESARLVKRLATATDPDQDVPGLSRIQRNGLCGTHCADFA